MARKSRSTSKKNIQATTHLTDDGLFLAFADIAGRVAIQHYANLIVYRDTQLAQRLSEAVEAAGSWGDSELEDALMPKGVRRTAPSNTKGKVEAAK